MMAAGCDDQAVNQFGSSQRSNVDEALEEDMGVKCACGCNEVCTVGSLRNSSCFEPVLQRLHLFY